MDIDDAAACAAATIADVVVADNEDACANDASLPSSDQQVEQQQQQEQEPQLDATEPMLGPTEPEPETADPPDHRQSPSSLSSEMTPLLSPPPPPPRSAPDRHLRDGGILGSYAPLLLSRSSSAGVSANTNAHAATPHYHTHSSMFCHTSANSHSSSELVHHLQRLCSRQRQRSEERQFVRDVERVLVLLRQQSHTTTTHAPRSRANTLALSASGAADRNEHAAEAPAAGRDSAVLRPHSTSLSDSLATTAANDASTHPLPLRHTPGALSSAEIELLVDCIAGLFVHRNYDVRAVAFETVTLCLSHYNEQLSSALRAKIFTLVATANNDFALRQRALRALTSDGRNVAPFQIELGWLLLQLLDASDEQRDLVSLIQSILRRSPQSLDMAAVVAITHVLCSRGDAAWTRGDVERCRKLLGFFHVLATHGLEHAASTTTSLRTLCCLVNADGHGTWSIMKHLLNSAAGYQVLRGLLLLLEQPLLNNQWVLRGAVFFLGMSCWGSQRVGKLEDVKWAPILLAMERVLACHNGVVIFEVILALQRLIKKFGAVSHKSCELVDSSGSGGGSTKRLIVEWDIILRMFRALRPWLSLADDLDSDDSDQYTNAPSMMTHPQAAASHAHAHAHSQSASSKTFLDAPFNVSIHQTRIPRELLDTLSVVEELVVHDAFAGDVEAFFDVLDEYLPHLTEASTLLLLRHRAAAAHPAYHVQWLRNLSDCMLSFFTNASMLGNVRLEALDVLRINLHCSRNICEDRVIEDVLVPTLSHVFDDHHHAVRRRGLDLVTEVARQLESSKFELLFDILANAVTLALYEDSQVFAIAGIVSLFSSCFDHLPHSRTLRMYELIAKVVETHRNTDVRRIALTCLLRVSEASSDFRLQWRDTHVRTSRFLFVTRRRQRPHQQQRGAFQRESSTLSTAAGACVPVARGLRAMLTLVSTETNAALFRMAVAGIRTMLENRIILTDVDMSDMTLKLISSIDYRAFGRAAIPDELVRLADEDEDGKDEDADERTHRRPSAAWDDHVTTRRWMENGDRHDDRHHRSRTRSSDAAAAARKTTSLRDTLVALCKTRFMAMGLELVALITSYARELTTNARRHLIACLVGALGMPLAVADSDLVSRSTLSSDQLLLLGKSRSANDVTRNDDDDDARVEHRGMASSSSSSTNRMHHAASAHALASMHPSLSNECSDIGASDRRSNAKPPTSPPPPHFGFTSRMLSRFQTAAATTSKRSSAAAEDAAARRQLHETLEALYAAESAVLQICTNVLSLLALRMPDDVADAIERVLHSARICFTTSDGVVRADGFRAALEMVANVVYALPTLRASHYEDVLELVTIGLCDDTASTTHQAYVSFRLLCRVVFKCAPADRIALATIVLPQLQQRQVRRHSLLIEAAIDFLLSFAFSRSFPPPPASSIAMMLQHRHRNADARDEPRSDDRIVVQSRSWVYNNALVTIDVTACGAATLVVRRANCTNYWDLQLARDYVIDPSAELPALMPIDRHGDDATDDRDDDDRTMDVQKALGGKDAIDLHRDDSVDCLLKDEQVAQSVADAGADAGESVSTRRASLLEDDDNAMDAADDTRAATEQDAMTIHDDSSALPVTTATLNLPPPVPLPVSQDGSASAATEIAVRKKWPNSNSNSSNNRKQVSFALAGNSPTLFPLHASAALPPLPAYDGIGGSPSYFCEAHPVRRRNELRMQSAATRSARGGAVRSTRDGGGESPAFASHYDNDNDDNDMDDGPDDFSLDGSSLQPLSARSVSNSRHDRRSEQRSTTRRSASSSSSTAATPSTTAGSSTSEQARVTPSSAAADDHDRVPTELSDTATAAGAAPTRTLDPLFLMMQLFDVTVANRPQLLANGQSLELGLSVLDRTPAYETHKIGLLYVRSAKQRAEASILRNTGGSVRYLKFLRGLGTFTKLQGLAGYSGGLDTTNDSDGKFGLIYKDDYTQIVFHVATMMGPERDDRDSSSHDNDNDDDDRAVARSKKRHIGNDFVHIVYKECDAEYDVATFTGQFNDVHIVIQPLNDREYRTHVHAKPGLAPFGPLRGTQVIASSVIAESVRLTCLNANLACQTFHHDLVGFAMNCEERLKQIKQLGLRLASGDDWKLDVQ